MAADCARCRGTGVLRITGQNTADLCSCSLNRSTRPKGPVHVKVLNSREDVDAEINKALERKAQDYVGEKL